MRAYELMVILSPEVEDRAVEPSLSKFLAVSYTHLTLPTTSRV